MGKSGAATLALAAVLCLFAFLPGGAQAATGSISGTVMDGPPAEGHVDCFSSASEAECGETVYDINGISGVEVCVWMLVEEEEAGCAVTDQNGAYLIEDLEPGEYGVEFWGKHLGYIPQYYDGQRAWWEADAVTVGTEAVTGIDAELTLGGTIEGTVTRLSGGGPVEEAEVCAWDPESEFFGGCTMPGSDGGYVLRGLDAGEYVVEFWPYEPDLMVQYFDGKRSSDEADLVPVALGETQTGIDAALEVGATISGTVRAAANGAPVEWVEICAWGAINESFGGCGLSNEAGSYAVRGVPTGDYKVEFWTGESGTNLFDQYWDHKAAWSEADVLGLVAGETVSGINADLLAPPPPFVPPAVTPPAVTPPAAAPRAAPKAPQRKRCRKGFKRKKVKGRVRCVKVRKHHRKRRHNRIALRGPEAAGLTRAAYRFGR
ncbi:MAG TPA: hypothetical protein VGV69_10260 [Solirubrobacterales bacterium]|nr:hypothetical protein [Solirubrobacterales bacterium]